MNTNHHTLRAYFIHSILFLSAALCLNAQDTVLVPCDSSTVGGTYCYVDNEDHAWLWQSECGAAIWLEFTSGTIESGAYDQLRIYDGPDNTAMLIYANPSEPGTVDLAGIQVVAISGYLYMELFSNDSNSCATVGLRDADTDWTWEWACSIAGATAGVEEAAPSNFSMYPNPATGQLTMRLPSEMSGPVELRILNTLGSVVLADHFTAFGDEVRHMDLRGLTTGSYCVALTTLAGRKTQRLQVIH